MAIIVEKEKKKKPYFFYLILLLFLFLVVGFVYLHISSLKKSLEKISIERKFDVTGGLADIKISQEMEKLISNPLYQNLKKFSPTINIGPTGKKNPFAD